MITEPELKCPGSFFTQNFSENPRVQGAPEDFRVSEITYLVRVKEASLSVEESLPMKTLNSPGSQIHFAVLS